MCVRCESEYLDSFSEAHFFTEEAASSCGFRGLLIRVPENEVVQRSRVQEGRATHRSLEGLVVDAKESAVALFGVQHELQRLPLVRTQGDR